MASTIQPSFNSNVYKITDYQYMINKLIYEDLNEITEDDKVYIIDFITTNKYNQGMLGVYANMMEGAYTKYKQKVRRRQSINKCRFCCNLFI